VLAVLDPGGNWSVEIVRTCGGDAGLIESSSLVVEVAMLAERSWNGDFVPSLGVFSEFTKNSVISTEQVTVKGSVQCSPYKL
jgi:hypothetical protein